MSKKSYLRRIAELRPKERFIYYINERLEIKRRRDSSVPREKWTRDPILEEYKFTNVRRDWDYTSRWIIQNWYEPFGMSPVCGMVAAFARFFPYVPTLEAIGFPEVRSGFKPETNLRRWFDEARKTLAFRQDRGLKIFSSAYIIGGIGSMRKSDWVITKFLTPVLESGVLMKSWDSLEIHERLREFSGWGDFMTQEVVLDLMHTFVLKDLPTNEKREYGWAGPGAIRGLNRVFGREVDQSLHRNAAQMEMKMLWEYLRKEGSELDEKLRKVLTVHDVEFNLCEFDKYSRALFEEGTPKQKFVPRESGELKLL